MLVENRIHDVTPLASLEQLEDLALGENFATDVSPLGSLIKLKTLHLYFNHVADLSPFLLSLNLKEIDASANPLSVKTISAHIPALESMGIEVDYDQSEENAAGREARQEAGKYEKLRDQLDKVKTNEFGDILSIPCDRVEWFSLDLRPTICHNLSHRF